MKAEISYKNIWSRTPLLWCIYSIKMPKRRSAILTWRGVLDKFRENHAKEEVLFYKPKKFQSFKTKIKISPKVLVRPYILTPPEYLIAENHILIQFILSSKRIVVLFYFISSGCRRLLQTFWAIAHVSYGLTVHAVTSSMFGMLTPVKSRYRGQDGKHKKLLISAKREELMVWKLF